MDKMDRNMKNEKRTEAEELLRFIEKSPSTFHVVDYMARELENCGYRRLYEEELWKLEAGGTYFVTRNDSALIAFALPGQPARPGETGFLIAASHSDSPTFKIKENPEISVEDQFVKLNVEKYGGMLMAPWFDRPLSVAGRLLVERKGRIETVLADVDRDLVMIPNLAIHMDRESNDGKKYNAQIDMQPLFGGREAKGRFMELVAEAAGVKKEEILGMDLSLYNRMPGTIWGAEREFLSSPKLDDLECAFASMRALEKSENPRHVRVHCVMDNEEVGSLTRQGAASTFLRDVLERICGCLAMNREEYLCALASSFMVSADNAHSVHPNYTGKADPNNRPYLNGGIVIKHSANQKYTTDGVSAAVFRGICKKAGVPYQDFTNRADLPGGSTLGNLSNGQVALRTVDIGLPQLAMHSPYETAGVRDLEYLVRALTEFFGTRLRVEKNQVRIAAETAEELL